MERDNCNRGTAILYFNGSLTKRRIPQIRFTAQKGCGTNEAMLSTIPQNKQEADRSLKMTVILHAALFTRAL